MLTSLFKFSISIAVLTIWAGIATAAFSGSQKAIELGWMPRVWQWVATSGQQSTQPEANPTPFVDLAQDAAGKITKQVKPSGMTSEPIPQPSNAPTVADMRLSACPQGSYDPQAAEVSLDQANRFKQAIAGGLKPTGFLTVQSFLGQPNCVINGKTYQYLIQGGKVVSAHQEQEGKEIKITFTGF